MKITKRSVDGVAILDLSGKIVLGDGDGQLRDSFRSLLEEGSRKILFNMAEVSYLDSSGLGTLISCHTTGQREGAAFKLCALQRKIEDLLIITKLITVFDVHETEKEALGSFK